MKVRFSATGVATVAVSAKPCNSPQHTLRVHNVAQWAIPSTQAPVILFQGGASLWILLCIYVSWMSLLCCLVCFLQPCDHLLERDDLLVLLCVVLSCVFVTFWTGIVLNCFDSWSLPSSLPLSNINLRVIVNFSAAMIAVNAIPCIRIVLDILEHALFPDDLGLLFTLQWLWHKSEFIPVGVTPASLEFMHCNWLVNHSLFGDKSWDFQITLVAEYVIWWQRWEVVENKSHDCFIGWLFWFIQSKLTWHCILLNPFMPYGNLTPLSIGRIHFEFEGCWCNKFYFRSNSKV